MLDNTIQIVFKVEKEKSEISLLKSRVGKYHNYGEFMSKILDSFEERLGILEHTIVPVYNNTELLQKRLTNLNSTFYNIENLLSHYDASQDECNLILVGPSEGKINTYLDAMNRIQQAKEYFLENNYQTMELQNCTTLFNTGCENICNQFKMLLKKHSSVLTPVELLDLIYIEDDSSNEDCVSIKQFPQHATEDLHILAEWLENNLVHQYKTIYADERSEIVYKSLKMLKDHQKSGSWGNGTSSKHTGRAEGIKKTTSNRIQNILETKANKVFMKASQSIEQSTGYSIRKSSGMNDSSTSDEFLDGDQDLDKYLILLLCLQRLLIWEKQLLSDIIPLSKQSDVFTKLSQTSTDMIVKDAENITTKVLRNIARKEWSSVLGVFSGLKRIIILQPEIKKAFNKNHRNQFADIIQSLQVTGFKALEQFIELIKIDSSSNLVGIGPGTISGNTNSNVPKDATVHELTSNSIWFIEHLYEFYDVIGLILMNDNNYVKQLDAAYTNKTLSNVERNKALLGVYIKKVLSELNLTIISKSEIYNDVATKYLFRLNNVHYILKSLEHSRLIDLVSMTEPTIEKTYQDLIQDIRQSYQKSWSKLLSFITPLDDLPKPSNGKLRDKERAIIKDNFSNFNKEFEEAFKTQKNISIPDIILREGLRHENSEYIIPHYKAFYDMYHDVQFSRNVDKYVKYRMDDISAMLSQLFDDSI